MLIQKAASYRLSLCTGTQLPLPQHITNIVWCRLPPIRRDEERSQLSRALLAFLVVLTPTPEGVFLNQIMQLQGDH
jgi:hypothetical protein